MASPQIEDGYTKIANEIMDALCRIRIPGEEMQVLNAILRKTYGWQKCEDAIALSQFVEMTGMNKPHIIQSIKGLLLKKVIIVTEKGNSFAKVYKFNKDYDKWKPLPKKVTLLKKVKSITEKSNTLLPKTVPTKENNTKEKKERHVFVIPTMQEVRDYCRQRQNLVDPAKWHDHYSSNGWKVGKNPMKDWQAAVRTWERSEFNMPKKESW